MKDIKIPGSKIRRELNWLLISLVLSFLLNAFSILKYKSPWTELITSLHVVVLVALIVYILLLFFRGLASLLVRLTGGRRKE